MAKEGKEVRIAFGGPDIEHDKLLDFCAARNREDRERSSSAGESRQKIGDFIESTGMNSQALSWCRTILKKLDKENGQAKAMDILMSLNTALPMIEAHVRGQGTVDMDFGSPEPEPMEPVGDDEIPAWDASDAELAGDAA